MRFLALLVLLMVAAILPVSAQEEATETDYIGRYAEIPHSRTEDGGFVLGDPEAPVALVEFADFMCPHCQTYHETVLAFIDEYVVTGKARFEYRFYPIVHPTYSVYTAQLAECADDQLVGGFWPAHDVLFDLAADGQIGPNTPESLAEALDISAEKLEACLPTAVQHETDQQIGRDIGVSGTPATLIRLANDGLGWPVVDESVMNRGGLPLPLIRQVFDSAELASMVIIPQQLLADLVEEPACDVACWRGIIPGVTPYADAVALVSGDLQNIDVTVEEATEEQPSGAVLWRTFDSGLRDYNYIVEGEDGTVAMIALLDVSNYTLGDVVAAQGEPESALAMASGDGAAILYLVYPEKNLMVLALVNTVDGLNEDVIAVGAQYYTAASMAEILEANTFPAWAGYDALEAYLGG